MTQPPEHARPETRTATRSAQVPQAASAATESRTGSRPAKRLAVPGLAFGPHDRPAVPTVQRAFANLQAAAQAVNPAPAGLTRVRNTKGLAALGNDNVLWHNGSALLYTKYWGEDMYYLSPLVSGVNDDGAPAEAFFVRIRSDGQAAGYCDADRNVLVAAIDYAAGWREEAANPALRPNAKHRDDLLTLIDECSGNIHSPNIHTVVGGFGAKGNGVKKIAGVAASARIDVQNPPGPDTFNVHFQVSAGSEACVVFHVSDPKNIVLDKLLASFDSGMKMMSPRVG